MICQSGFVSAIADEHARIAIQPRSACQACAKGEGCGMGLFTGWFSRQGVAITVPSQEGWKVGDQVAVQLESSELTRLALWAYGAPLASFLLAIAGFSALAPAGPLADLGGFVVGAVMMVVCAWIVGRSTRPRSIVGMPRQLPSERRVRSLQST